MVSEMNNGFGKQFAEKILGRRYAKISSYFFQCNKNDKINTRRSDLVISVHPGGICVLHL